MTSFSSEIRRYAPAIALDRILLRKVRAQISRTLLIVLFLLAMVIVSFVIRDSFVERSFVMSSITGDAHFITGMFFILLSVYGVILQTTFFYNTLYYRGLSTVYGEDFADGEGLTQEVASMCMKDELDLTRGFLISKHGKEIMIRSGVSLDAVDIFLDSERSRIRPDTFPLTQGAFITIQSLGEFLLANDSAFKSFLFKNGVTPASFLGANEWVWRVRAQYKQKQRWWSRDQLGTFSGIGREFSYGTAINLNKFERNIEHTSAFSVFLSNTAYANEVIEKIETTLTRIKSANVILVGEPGVGKMDILIELGRRMREGHSVASLSAKRFVVFDVDAFVAVNSSKGQFEYEFLKLMTQTERAGNIIVIIENFVSFVESVSALDADVANLLERFLTSSNIQIVATVDPQNFHLSLENNHQLLRHFETIIIDVPDISSSVRVLEEATWALEHRYNLYFTYPAVERIAESAELYIMEGVMPDKAVSFLTEVAAHAGKDKREVVDPDFVDVCISGKTGIPTGPVTDTEREMLMNLEELLHTRVVGQERAIEVVASAMRRARSGIQSKERPIGTFLFLGSTGVGKTETAKALAYTFFGDENTMVRFDMSEFSDENSMARLLGTSEVAGVLPSALREHPYCVLLLDEFEKSNVSVHDLFLQIFDEGVFTDARGNKINARNTIIIATSNAGSDLIWKYVKEGKHPEDEKDVIIDTIIERHIYKPEFLNRFDAIVLFEVLQENEQRTIAEMMLKDLQSRIRERGFELVIDDVLLTVLMREGYDPEFGARPMRRAIQDLIEERVAFKIIEGGLKPGDSIRFEEKDFAKAE